MNGRLVLENVRHRYGSVEVLGGIDLNVEPGEFLAVVGPSGSGKSTLLAILSGYLKPTSGNVHREGRTRTVHQSDGLYPWLTVAGNLRLGLGNSDRAAIDSMIERIGLTGFAGAYPHELSGGMRQRVEIARALCGDTDILMLDEPFSALDYLTRLKMRTELCRLLADRPRTVVLVTHDIEEAAQLADRIVLLSDRPARIVHETCIDSPRPRDVVSPAVVDTTHAILQAMGWTG